MSPVIKKKGEPFHLPSKYILLILTILCVGMMLITLTTDFTRGPINGFVGTVVTPFQAGISEVGGYLSKRVDELVEIRDLLQENEELKRQIDELTLQNTLLQQDRFELYHLRELYELDQAYEGYTKVGARIIAKDAGNWFSSFIIDKGTDDGLAVDMNVIADGGLVGRITVIGPTWARVDSVIADNANVSGMVLSTADRVIVSGSLELMASGRISFSQLIDSDNEVMVGDKIVTSNISDKYLPGIVIGYITQINTDANNLSKSGYLTPAVDFEHLEAVLVILDMKQTVGQQ